MCCESIYAGADYADSLFYIHNATLSLPEAFYFVNGSTKKNGHPFCVKCLVFIALRDKAVPGPRSRVIHRGVQDNGRVLIWLLEQRKVLCLVQFLYVAGSSSLGVHTYIKPEVSLLEHI